jgi:hypothetical protein
MTRLSRLGRTLAACLALLAAGCAERGIEQLYVPLGTGAGYGYTDHPAGDRRFVVTYDAPVRTAFSFNGVEGKRETDAQVARAFDLALLHAADIAIANGAPAFRVSNRENDVNVRSYPSYRDPFWYPGWRHPGYPYAWSYGPFYDEGYAALSARVTLTIELENDVGEGSYDARNVQATIRARYTVPPAS